MAALLFEMEGIDLILETLDSIIGDDPDSPIINRSEELKRHCSEILENYIGVENDFSDNRIKEIYYHFLLDVLKTILGNLQHLMDIKNEIKHIEVCELGEYVLMHIGDKNDCK